MNWEDIAGLSYAKKTIKEIVVWPLLRPWVIKRPVSHNVAADVILRWMSATDTVLCAGHAQVLNALKPLQLFSIHGDIHFPRSSCVHHFFGLVFTYFYSPFRLRKASLTSSCRTCMSAGSAFVSWLSWRMLRSVANGKWYMSQQYSVHWLWLNERLPSWNLLTKIPNRIWQKHSLAINIYIMVYAYCHTPLEDMHILP